MWLHHAGGAFADQALQVDAVDQVDRVYHVALGLRHLLAFGIAHQAVHIHRVKRHLLAKMQGHHDHPGHPEENDIEAGDEYRGRVEGRQLGCFPRPAQGGKGPQGGGEPGVQHILVLPQDRIVRQRIVRPHLGLARSHIEMSRLVIPGRDAVAPPQLAADTPVLYVPHPGEVGVFPLLWHKLDRATFHGGDRRPGHCPGIDVPLVGQVRFDHHAGAVAARHPQGVGIDFGQQPERVHVGDDALARRETVEAPIGGGRRVIDRRVIVEDIDHGQAVAAPHLVVIEVVGGCYLHHAGAELAVDIVIGDDGNLPARQWQCHHPSDQVAVAFVCGMNGDSGVAQHGLGPGGRHCHVALTARQRIVEVPQLSLLLFRHHFQIGDGGVQHRVPVDQALAAVDEPLAVEPYEHLLYRFAEAGIHGEALPRPVQR